MTPRALTTAVAVLLLVEGSGQARSLALRTEPPLPFSTAELRAAVELRLPLSQDGAEEESTIRVRRSGRDRIEIAFRQKRRLLQLEGRRGAQAARWVALAVVDLVMGEVEVLGPPRAPASRRVTATRPASRRVTATRPASRPVATVRRQPPRPAPVVAPPTIDESRPLLRVALLGGIGGGSNGDRPTGLILADASLRLRGPLRAVTSIGAALTSPASLEGGSVDLYGLPIRMGLAWALRRPRIELRLAFRIEPYWVSASSGALSPSQSSVLVGSGVAAFYLLRLTRRLDLLLGAGLDTGFNRAEYQLRGQPAMATERLLVWAGAGIGARTLR